MRTRKKKPVTNAPPPAYPLPDDVTLTPAAQEDWARLTRLLPLNQGPRLLFVLVDSPVLRRRLADHLAAALTADGNEVARIDLTAPSYQPLEDIFALAATHPQARFLFLLGLERSLISPEHRLGALAHLNLHRDQISKRLTCPLVIWTTDSAFTDLARHAPDFVAWRSEVFTLADPSVAIEAPYRQHLIDRYGKLTLYSVTSDAPLAVDLEQVFVKLTATQQRRTVVHPTSVPWESLASEEDATLLPSLVSSDRAIALVTRGSAHEPVEEVTVTLSLTEALQNSRYLAVIGAPGAGKTTLLCFLALTFARRQAPERLGLDEERLPLFVTLCDFSRFLEVGRQDDATPHRRPDILPNFLTAHTQKIAPHLHLPDDFFRERLTHGKCMVLLDGLDEVADPHQRARVAEAVAAFTQHYRDNRFVVTSRPRGYEGVAQQQLARLYASCTIRDFDDADMAAFAHHWYAAVTRDRMGDTPAAVAEAQRQADDLLRTIRNDQRVQALAHNPLLLSVLAMVHQRGVGLPQRRAELYDECTDMLLGYWDQTKGGEAARELATYGALTRGEKRTLLEPIALWFHERGEQGLEATQDELEQEIAGQFMELFGDDQETAYSRATLFLRVIDERAGLLVERSTGVYAFAHLTFQEYLAARAIAAREDYIAYTLQHLHDPWWREVLLLEVGHLSDVRHDSRRARRLASDLIRAIRNADSWLEDVLKRDLLFAVRCLCDTGKLGVDNDLRNSLMDELITLWRTTPYAPQRQEIEMLFAYAMPTVDGERVYTELLRYLDDTTMRRAAARALGQLGAGAATPEVLGRLMALIADTDRDWSQEAAETLAMRCRAAQTLERLWGETATPEALGRLLALITDTDRGMRQVAARALERMGAKAATPEVLGRLVALTADTDADVRQEAIVVLGRLGARAATPEVLERLVALIAADTDGIMRSVVACALGLLGSGAATPEVLGRLLALTADTDRDVRQTAAEVLGWLGSETSTPEVLERLLALTADTDRGMRQTAISALSRLGTGTATPEVLGRLLALTADRDKGVRRAAIWALSGLGTGTATPEVLGCLVALTADRDRDIHWAAAEVLGRLGGRAATPEVLERLLALTADTDRSMRQTAIWALGQLGAGAATPILLECLVALIADRDRDIGRAAAWALERLGARAATPEVLERLLALTADTDRGVCQAAAKVLGELGAGAMTPEVLERLAQFWQAHLANSELLFIGNQTRLVCDVAYEQLQQIATRRGARIEEH